MASLKQDVATKISTEAAKGFVREYYNALNTSRDTIQTFYVTPSLMPDGKPLPTIVYNGNIVPDPGAMQTLFKEQMPPTKFEVQSYDCQVLNPDYVVEGSQAAPAGSGRNMSLLIIVSGYVKYGEVRSVDPVGFSETFILVPNVTGPSGGRGKRHKEWVIQSQTFRQVS